MQLAQRARVIPRLLNPRSELFASTFTYGATAVIKLGSSLVLTRLLTPQAYGIFGILMSFVFIVELVSDVGIVAFLIRHPRGTERRFIHTTWTVRLIRSCLNFGVLFAAAPLLAGVYGQPVLIGALRVFSLQFLITGLESMAFPLAQRDRKARISNYTDLITNTVMTLFVIGAASVLRNHMALIYGVLLQRTLTTVASHFFYRDVGVGFALDREVVMEQLRFARFVFPSSLLTIALSQYDKLVLLKLFSLSLVGLYSIGGNMVSPISGVIVHNARIILYARCAEYFRIDRASARARYYQENQRLLTLGVVLPAMVAGFSQSFISILYDVRYAMIGPILLIMGLGTIVGGFQNASENLLVAAGKTQMYLLGNVARLLTAIPLSLLGYFLFGFYGFLWFGLGGTVLVLFYYYYQQHRAGLLDGSQELRLAMRAAATFAVCYALSHLLLHLIPPQWLHLSLHRHHAA